MFEKTVLFLVKSPDRVGEGATLKDLGKFVRRVGKSFLKGLGMRRRELAVFAGSRPALTAVNRRTSTRLRAVLETAV
jgi:hypothetical protein